MKKKTENELTESKEPITENSDFSIKIDNANPGYETEPESGKTSQTRTRRKRAVKKEFPIPLVNLAEILATLPCTLIRKWLKSFPELTKEERAALIKAWSDYLEYALEPDVITPAHSLLVCYVLLFSTRAIAIVPEISSKIKAAKEKKDLANAK